jgi:hypothetical protein
MTYLFKKKLAKSHRKTLAHLKRFQSIADMGCCICQKPCQIHHLIGLSYKGLSQKADNRFTIGLCVDHHTGREGIHIIGKKTWETAYGTQEEHLKVVDSTIGWVGDD